MTTARPRSAPVRAWLWARRNKAWATALAASLVLTFAVGGFILQRARASAAEARAETETTKAEAARQREREALMLALQGERLTSRTYMGWFEERLWPKVRDAARLRRDAELRSQALATLEGLDARLRKSWEGSLAYSLCFDSKGRLLMGGEAGAGARLWDGSPGEPPASKQRGYGPAVFRPDGSVLQLAAHPEKPYAFLLWDMTKQAELRTLVVPGADGKKPRAGEVLPRMELSADGALAAVAATFPDDSGGVVVWDVGSGKVLHRFAVKAQALAFSPPLRGTTQFLAAGEADGGVTVWSLPKGEQAASFNPGKSPVKSLAFGQNVRRGDGKIEQTGLGRWLLAVGQAGGSLTVWDPEAKKIHAFCHGSLNDVNAVTFSPDGMTLASVGRGRPKLWDVATGRFLLESEGRGHPVAVAFSADGKRLATSSFPVFGMRGGVDVWDLIPGRGIQTLRGLTGPFFLAAFSRDGRLVAAMAHNWQVAVWDREANQLRHVFEPPTGPFLESALDFSPDGKRLAFSANRTALVWDLESGRQIQSWELPVGFVDYLSYRAADQLLLFRVETPDPKMPPYATDPRRYPRVCKIRNLLDKTAKAIEVKELNWHVFGAKPSPSANCFIVDGLRVEGKEGRRFLKAIDAKTGAILWSIPLRRKAESASMATDPAGELLCADLGDGDRVTVVEVSSGRTVRQLEHAGLLGPRGEILVTGKGYQLLAGAEATAPLFRVGIDQAGANAAAIDRSGRFLAWGGREGWVSVCDLKAAAEHLDRADLGW